MPRFTALLSWGLALLPTASLATGITADVGLTPPLDRWIFRTQLRYMERSDDPTEMARKVDLFAVPLVMAYGLRPDTTVVARQIFRQRDIDARDGGKRDTGRDDFALIGKYRLLRVNRPQYIIGIAPTLGVEFPTGDDTFGSESWDGIIGTYFSGRMGPWGSDLNLEYKANGLDNRDTREGDEFIVNAAVAYQFSLGRGAKTSVWPVLEVLLVHRQPDRVAGADANNSGEDVVYVSPGLKFAYQSFMLEGLIQFPVSQHQQGAQLERKTGGLIGVRYLF